MSRGSRIMCEPRQARPPSMAGSKSVAWVKSRHATFGSGGASSGPFTTWNRPPRERVTDPSTWSNQPVPAR